MTAHINPLARAKGLGSAKHGTGHWWAQRLTAIALIPLTIWLVFCLLTMVGAPQAEVVAWLGRPWNAVLVSGLVIALFYHAQLGMQVVVEDYVHQRGVEVCLQVTIKFAAIGGALAFLFAILRAALQS